ncbi:MAG: hypothetical protein COW79_12315 [Bdellovibrionales bacterium CG22_combo_CG10-13_8_21_14_all_38_13]|nr:MAG: hypothetical protein COW79_12315 [Bdellovibrionales bacterium CG22_combo_CG10-13_8_21_14_all_38_13]
MKIDNKVFIDDPVFYYLITLTSCISQVCNIFNEQLPKNNSIFDKIPKRHTFPNTQDIREKIRGSKVKVNLLFIIFISLITFKAYGQTSPLRNIFSSNKEHELILLNNGIAAFEKRIQLIESAKRSIDLETFIFDFDVTGTIILQKLIEKSLQGVRVRLLLDSFMISETLNDQVLTELTRYGITSKFYNRKSVLTYKGQFRNHRKSIIIDDEKAIIGGRNISDAYFELDANKNYLDREILIQGEIVSKIQESFNNFWNSSLTSSPKHIFRPSFKDIKYQNIKKAKDFTTAKQFFQYDISIWDKEHLRIKNQLDQKFPELETIRSIGEQILEESPKFSCSKNTFISDFPGLGKEHLKNDRYVKYEIFKRITQAQQKVVIDSPFFILDNETKPLIKNMLLNGVEVEIMTNGLHASDPGYAVGPLYSQVKKYLDYGLNLFLISGESPDSNVSYNLQTQSSRFVTHSKSIIFDSKSSMIGSFNFDPRSNNLSTELAYFCDDNIDLANEFMQNIQDRMDVSAQIDDKKQLKKLKFLNASFGQKILYYGLKFPSLMLINFL